MKMLDIKYIILHPEFVKDTNRIFNVTKHYLGLQTDDNAFIRTYCF